MKLKHLTDKALLEDTKTLAGQYRSVTTKLLHHIREVERRKLFSDLGYSSLFNYVVQELNFSEPSAARRIKAARLLAEVPEIETKIESGELNLTNIGKAADAFKSEGITDKRFKLEILGTIENTSTRTCEKALLEITGPLPPPIKEIKPLTKTTNLLSVILTDDELEIYEELKGLIRTDIWMTILTLALEQIKKRKFKTTAHRPLSSSSTRFIPASLKRAVYERDRVCTSCGSKVLLEYDHIKPFSMGGKTELGNLRLLCRACNQRARLRQNLTATYHKNT